MPFLRKVLSETTNKSGLMLDVEIMDFELANPPVLKQLA